MNRLILLTYLCIGACTLSAQMEINGITLYGNEWIDYDKTYWKVTVAEDGMYQLGYQQLLDAGFPSDVPLSRIQVFHFGEEYPVHRSTEGVGSADDYLLFYGERNRGRIDQFIYTDDVEMFNPEYSLVNDNSAYFVTVSDTPVSTKIDYTVANLVGNTITPESYYLHDEKLVWTDRHYKPTANTSQVQYSTMMGSEGFGSNLQQVNSFTMPTDSYVAAGPAPVVDLIMGGNNNGHTLEISANGNLKTVVESDPDKPFYSVMKGSFSLQPTDMTSNISFEVRSVKSATETNRISVANLRYPRAFDFTGATSAGLTIPASNSLKYIELEGFDGGSEVLAYVTGTGELIQTASVGSKVGFLLSATGADQEVYIYTSAAIITPTAIGSGRQYEDYSAVDHNYIIISNSRLTEGTNGSNPVQAYADYRATINGGGYDPIVVDIDQLYDQFAYGIDHHFISIKNFNHFVSKEWTDIQAEFIIGKAREYQDYRRSEQIAVVDNFFVPSFGNPGSDILLATSLAKVDLLFPVGRLAAVSADDVDLYLEKVMEHDANMLTPQTIEDKLWQKRIIHLSGGKDLGERENIANSLAFLESIAETNKYAGETYTFFKKSGEPIVNATSDEILDLVNGGVSIITFFGHSSAGTFDFNLDNVTNYSNQGKYPIIFSLGCYAGNIHTSQRALSEQFVLERGKGAIAFVASTGSAYLPTLRNFGADYYEDMGTELYGGTIGDIITAVVDTMNEANNLQTVTFLQQIALHGDPAIQMVAFPGPDLTIDSDSPSTDPTFVDNYQDDFTFCFDGVNLGTYTADSVDIRVRHLSPAGEVVTDSLIRVMMPSFTTEYCVTLPLADKNLIGQNKILVDIDASNEIDELPGAEAESNNSLLAQNGVEGFSFFILSNSAVPTYPYKYSIVNESSITLTASTYNALSTAQNFVIQVDTSGDFDSGFLQTYQVANAIGTIQQPITLGLPAGTVYYWRVSPEVTNQEIGYVWSSSSFLYEPSLGPGYNQSHYHQFRDNEFNNMTLNPNTRDFEFARNFREVRIEQRFYGDADNLGKYFVDNTRFNSMYHTPFSPAIGVAVVDTVGTFKRNEAGGSFGAENHKTNRIFTFYFRTNVQEKRVALINFLADEIPDGHYVSVYPILNSKTADFKREEWASDAALTGGKTIMSVLGSQGAELFDDFYEADDVLPYALMYRQNIGILQEQLGTSQNDIIDVKTAIPGLWFEGSTSTQMVGPASSWSTLDWSVFDEVLDPKDSLNVSIYGIDVNGNEVLLIDSTEERIVDLSSIDATEYPFLKLSYYATDIWALTPIQLRYWRIFYSPLADLGIAVESNSIFVDSLQEGANLLLDYTIKNNTAYAMPATEVSYDLINEGNQPVTVEEIVPAIGAFGEIDKRLSYSTAGLSGDYRLQLTLNKAKNPSEMYYFNNLGFTEFQVVGDQVSPVLDVTFDGVPILENDIVSAEPLISVTLKDENQYLLLSDTQLFELALMYPDGTLQQVDVSSPEVQFTPATGDDNKARLDYNPSLQADGTYKLMVRARDASSNVAGESVYEVSFRVYNEEMVSNVFNYPNPFSTSTQFVFTLTGNEDPGNILIRIMTVTGKVVKEITMAELGNVHIGVNKTDYKWDGTDEYGDRLANGVYLYQVITKKLDGSDYSNFSDPTQNTTDWMFKEGFGKMVIMR